MSPVSRGANIDRYLDSAEISRSPLEASQELIKMALEIKRLAPNSASKKLSARQAELPLEIAKEREIEGIGMGVLSDGTPYLNQRGLALLCGVQNTHIGNISKGWNDPESTPRIEAIKKILESAGVSAPVAHYELTHLNKPHFAYPGDVCLAILEYYAFDAGANISETARSNFRKLAGSKLRDMVYSKVGYDPTGANRFDKWHERLSINYQSAPRGFFHVFNEADTIIYELINAGATIDEHFVADISIGTHWSKHWEENDLSGEFGDRQKYPHRYPDDHPQAKSNPQISWCYPLAALGYYRQWLQDDYLGAGKFKNYLATKVAKGDLPPSFAELALEALVPKQITN